MSYINTHKSDINSFFLNLASQEEEEASHHESQTKTENRNLLTQYQLPKDL